LKRWLTVVVGVGVAAAAFYALLATPPSPRSGSGPSAPAREDIDDASRDRLERVLREAAGTRTERTR
jgi:hypothetical protein